MFDVDIWKKFEKNCYRLKLSTANSTIRKNGFFRFLPIFIPSTVQLLNKYNIQEVSAYANHSVMSISRLLVPNIWLAIQTFVQEKYIIVIVR